MYNFESKRFSLIIFISVYLLSSRGLMVKADGTRSRSRGFQSRHRILDGCWLFSPITTLLWITSMGPGGKKKSVILPTYFIPWIPVLNLTLRCFWIWKQSNFLFAGVVKRVVFFYFGLGPPFKKDIFTKIMIL